MTPTNAIFIRTNTVLYRCYMFRLVHIKGASVDVKHKDIINFAKAQRLGWYGHVDRMQETRMVKAIHSWKPISIRQTGRPKIRWQDDVRKDLQRMNVPNWKTLVQHRKRWIRSD